MDRITFAKMIVNARTSSGLTMKTIMLGLKTLPSNIYKIEKGACSFSVEKCLPYLSFLGYSIKLSKEGFVTIVHSNSDLIEWEKNIRGIVPQIVFSESISYDKSCISYIEAGKHSMSIDMMLKIAEVYGYTVEIVPNNQNDTQL